MPTPTSARMRRPRLKPHVRHDVLTGPLPDPATLQAQLKTTLPVSTLPATPSTQCSESDIQAFLDELTVNPVFGVTQTVGLKLRPRQRAVALQAVSRRHVAGRGPAMAHGHSRVAKANETHRWYARSRY